MRILIIHTAFIGDIVLSTPLIQKIRDIYPESEIDYLTLPGNKSIISNNPNLRDIILYDKKGADKGIKGFFRILKIVKNNKYDLAIIPHRFIRSIMLAKMAGIKKLVGFDVATGSFLLTDVRHYDMKKHEVERLLDLVDYNGERVPLGIYPSEEDYKKINEILNGRQYRNLITVAPGSQRPEKIWPMEKYDELIKRLTENKENLIAITGGKAEKSLKSDIVISNDSAPIHIGSAFEKPFVIGIFGPGKRGLGFFPWTEKSNVIEDNEFYENSITAIPEKQHAYSKEYYKGIPGITVDRVYGEVVKRLEEKNGK